MNEFKGTPGPWELDGTEIYPVAGHHATDAICGMAVGFSDSDAALIAAAPELLKALQDLLDSEPPLTGNPSRERLIEHWEYEKSVGNGYADVNLFALRTLAKALGESK